MTYNALNLVIRSTPPEHVRNACVFEELHSKSDFQL